MLNNMTYYTNTYRIHHTTRKHRICSGGGGGGVLVCMFMLKSDLTAQKQDYQAVVLIMGTV